MKKSSPRFTDLTPLSTTKYNVIIQALDNSTSENVIIKTPRIAYVADPVACGNLIHEAKILTILGALAHVQQYIANGIEHDHGHEIPYLVTRKALGKTLYETVRDDAHKGRYTHRDGVMLMRDIAEALFPAHELGVIHCDLKLGNILWNNETHHCTIMDWGAAVQATEQDRKQSDPVIGTAQFMSYEHITGATLDQRTDIYALGIIITLLVYGQELTPRYSVIDGQIKKRSKEETSDAVAKKETIKTELFTLPESGYDWSLQQLLKRMTHWDRELRPRSMQEIVEECKKILQ